MVEILVSAAILAVLALSVYGVYASIVKGIVSYRERTTVSSLADHYLEIARNLPYSKIGTLSGNPHGDLPDYPNLLDIVFNGTPYQVYYVVNYFDDPADGTIILGNDPAPNDYKQIKLYIKNPRTEIINSFLTNIAPKGLEGMDSGGAIAIKVFDAVGQPVPNATIRIQNSQLNPSIDLTRLSDASGNWVEVGLPDSDNSYHITASKTNYSTDSTYPISESNPNPVKPDSTVLNGQVTQVSFSIDKLSNLAISTLDQDCAVIDGIVLGLRGAKLVGTTPDVYKFDNVYTSNSSGQILLSNIEWDNYTPAIGGPTYMIYGSSPIQRVSLMPDTSQNFTLLLGPKTDNSLLVIVKDASSGSAIEGASVELQRAGYDQTKLTGGSIKGQQEWSGGSGQEDFEDETEYFQDDGNIDVNTIPSGVRLKKIGESYASSGYLTSSTFDTGTDATAYTTLTWQPTSQDPATEIKFQLAANNDKEGWNFAGPDGTSSTYYTVPGTTIDSLDGRRYIRYRVFLSTADSEKTPVLTGVTINYVSGCFAPGQASFAGLDEADDYSITISMSGYQAQTINDLSIGGYQILEVSLGQ